MGQNNPKDVYMVALLETAQRVCGSREKVHQFLSEQPLSVICNELVKTFTDMGYEVVKIHDEIIVTEGQNAGK